MSIAESPDMLSEEADPKMQGLEKFETTMLSLGLSERKPIPEPISFPEPDPLGASLVAPSARQDDVSTSLGENNKQTSAVITLSVTANVFITGNSNLFNATCGQNPFLNVKKALTLTLSLNTDFKKKTIISFSVLLFTTKNLLFNAVHDTKWIIFYLTVRCQNEAK